MQRLDTFSAREAPGLLDKALLTHPFNAAVSCLVVGRAAVSLDGLAALTVHCRLALADLLGAAFLAYVAAHPDALVMGMAGAVLETDPFSVAVDNHGVLWANMAKHCYERFGLEGRPTDRTRDRFLVQVDLRDERLRAAESRHQARVTACLARLCTGPLDFVVSFATPAGRDAFQACFPTRPCAAATTEHTLEQVWVPAFPADAALREHAETDALLELEQWAGLVLHDCRAVLQGARQDPFVCALAFDEVTAARHDVRCLTYAQPFHPQALLALLRPEGAALLAVLVAGSRAAPTTWDGAANRSDARGSTAHGLALFIDGATGRCCNYRYASCSLR